MTKQDDFITDDTAATSEEEQEILITKEGLQQLKEELDELKNVRRKEVAERLREAISYGDLSENAEYEEAKNEQAFVEGRILELEKKIKLAKIISGKQAGKSQVVDIGSTVTVLEKGERGDPETYTIVGSTEANPIEHKISNESPIGNALLGRSKGDVVEVEAPGGQFKYEIVKIS
ncbi:transcription elongation factor GreA [Candidatus Peribacteria bacterium]|jgi:transcription elongation factor GreA|nr:transcription elongation factor GreA [Candidatus Peribacteria bacterium]MBT4021528.1 transcription elongation factor GreA [Candidatus Peribacteria bacterium]MBT4240621.1 transcription elongation factor GreA [Candidatus Peribacteria bacterium]MBT4474627.1 transcription elongation factor GreA [Candidatus Peribacteria bacterium]